ncbi:MAG: phosphoribosylformylglycinamidine synthase subunit PurS [Exiguobacterium sp.]|nr:phosphoribosylformylglycinamidine synthase subunit PurS [Exiguobacterium sp.]MBR2681176.1 phosphoribosylformylglycinamidine synthase subunit PurS [Exiguobacterium sp.]MBR2757032.1 phosphoribosylformylglycinamidine synthase subunit PurS [Exiguobacterium sp.]MBR3217543.1 phosphoribosylformylglycinamidine synthase subunit PurS [Exiguobacterium sp.]MBR3321623.1 phosphoribosylformylglycinamidine synthase subunit PurS [Exiguobacterium sp.]
MKKVNVYVTLRESVLDPQGVAVKGGLEHLGFAGVESVRIGKVIELQVADHTTENMVKEMCEKLLVNTVIENFEIEMGVLA